MFWFESEAKLQTRVICFCMLVKRTAWFGLGLLIVFGARLTIILVTYEQPRRE